MRIFRCYNADCTEHPHGRPGFDFPTEGDGRGLECPKCGGTLLTPVVIVHLMVSDKSGPIKTPGGRRRVVCQPDAVKPRGRFTGAADAVNCSICLTSRELAKMKAATVDADEHEIPVGTPLIMAGKDASDGS